MVGLDDPDVLCIRSVALALKFELVSMKKRRAIQQPLNGLAVEIINEAAKILWRHPPSLAASMRS
jgi:hypothetical protein